MPRRQPFTEAGRRRLRGPRRTIRPRGIPRYKAPVRIWYLENGQPLNAWESLVAWALWDLKITFRAQAPLGPQRQRGSSLVDFLLPDHKIALEVQGPFHGSAEGRVKDYYRRVNREYYGYDMVEITQNDFAHIHDVLQQVVGYPLAAVATRGRRL